MLRLLALFVIGAQSSRTSFLAAVTADGRFKTLEECEKAYEELLGKMAVTQEPEYVPGENTTFETAVEPVTPAPMVKGEVGGGVDTTEAKKAYHPPATGGVPSEKKGWDYLEHGDDWESACKSDGQSPIDIQKNIDIGGQTKSVMWFDYFADHTISDDTTAKLFNDGHGIAFQDSAIDLGFVKIALAEYTATEYIFHSPAEHTIDGQVYPLELQIYHKGEQTVAVSILFKYGPSNPFLASMVSTKMPVWDSEKATTSASSLLGNATDAFNLEHVLNLGGIHPGGDMTFYNYEGSLTQPPCSKGVQWYVSKEPTEATKAEINHIKEAIFATASMRRGNNRMTQPLGSRKVLVSHTGVQHHFKNHGHLTKDYAPARGYSSQDTPWQES